MTVASFSLLTAFSKKVDGGNPAAVVFLDATLPTETLQSTARNLNQPMTSFVFSTPLPSVNEETTAFAIRWFTPAGVEVPICGHGTLAAAQAVFDNPELVTKAIKVIEFHTVTCGVMTARKSGDSLIEIQLPSGKQFEITGDERAETYKRLTRMFGKEDLAVNYIGKGVDNFSHCLLVELDKKEDLKNCHVDASALHSNGFTINIMTTASNTGNELFVSRMFAPGLIPGDEDHVCGSAHCVMTPYWSQKRGITRGQEIKATQVSPRGGDLTVVWDSDKDIVKLKGEVTSWGEGKLCLP